MGTTYVRYVHNIVLHYAYKKILYATYFASKLLLVNMLYNKTQFKYNYYTY